MFLLVGRMYVTKPPKRNFENAIRNGRQLTYMDMDMHTHTQTWTRTSRRSCLACFGGLAPAKAIGCTMIRCRLVSVFFLSSFLSSQTRILSLLFVLRPFCFCFSASEAIPWRFFVVVDSILPVRFDRICQPLLTDTDLTLQTIRPNC